MLLPAGIVDRVDTEDEKIFVNRTKQQIRAAPEFDGSTYREGDYRDRAGGHYGPGGRGYTV